MKPNIIIILSVILFSSGCVSNPFSKFYKDNTENVPPEVIAKTAYPYSGTTQIHYTSDHDADAKKIAESDYKCLGSSGFTAGWEITKKALKQHAKSVGADVVLYSKKYLGSSETMMPMMRYNPGQTAVTTTHGTVSSGSRFATYQGTSTTTTSGSLTTQMVPMTVSYYSYSASFWRKGKPRPPMIFGAAFDVIPEDMRQKLQRNTGTFVHDVAVGTPAFNANVLKGDVIIRIGDSDVVSPDDMIAKLDNLAGQKITIHIIRHGKPLEIEIQLNQRP